MTKPAPKVIPGGMLHKCLHCGDPFKPAKGDAAYCGGACRTAACRRRKARNGSSIAKPSRKRKTVTAA